MYRQYPFSEQKQQEAKVKVKETDPTCSQIWLFPVTLSHALSTYPGRLVYRADMIITTLQIRKLRHKLN